MTRSLKIRFLSRLAVGTLIVFLCAENSKAGFTPFEAAGANAAAITATRDSFRTAVGGGTVAGANGSFGGVRREINWDGVPDTSADPNAFAGNFFNARGVGFATPGTGFRVSANAGGATAPLFGFPNDFATFSPQRLFTAVNSNITDVTFFVPGTNTSATTSAFGLVFVDVETQGQTKIDFFDSNNTLLFSRDAMIGGNQGMTFLGGVANAGEKISRVRITSGLNTITGNGVLGNPNDDIVVMDDFLYAEPVAVPEPGTIALLAIGACGLIALRRKALPS
jgi:hypothetical protein